ncbi:MAG TPA: non-ribosomal peptide synthetase, partial [Thermoanaerobaculia bacterium]|nr:non-ribosomal peptide synthetase [Thermoanaerobaculia bacterium]
GGAERILAAFESLLVAAAEHPDHPVGSLALLGPAARHQLLVEWNDTGVAYTRESSVPELFAEVAARRPEAVAMRQGERSWSYGELASRAGRLARRLRAHPGWGGPETVVALLTGRSPETAVGALGVVTAGGAYLPVDPDYPAERIAHMLEDSGAVAVVAREDLRERLPEGGPPILVLDAAEAVKEAAESADELRRPDGWQPERLAYVIYTSGSTGKPKGVELTHRGLANLVAWHRRAYSVAAGDRTTLLSGPGFDASVWELWPVLAAGGALHVPPEELRSAPEELLAWFAAEGITIAFLATPLAEAALDAIRSRGAPEGLRLRALLTGGDRLHRPPPEGLPFAVVNHYGPTEATVVTTAGAVGPDSRTPPPIGRPIAGMRVYLLGRDLEPVPAGVPGELFVGGDGLARGYLARPALTAAAFVPDPFAAPAGAAPGARQLLSGGAPGARLYRTGDLARWLLGGEVEFLGRIDGQVKLRGFRIELGEIESVLAAHPAVAQAAVAVREDRPENRRLVAYVVPADGAALAPAALRVHLAGRLPDYMMPAAYVALAELPLTPNGKIDRAALPAPEEEASAVAREREAPRGPLEELVAGVLAEVLGVSAVGADDDFFELGGHSLLATRVMSRLRELAGAEVPLRRLFEGPTVAELAAVIEELRRGGAGGRRPPP